MEREATKWTPDSVRDILPNVRVLVDGIERSGFVRGRRSPWACVHIEGMRPDVAVMFSWDAVASALNNDRPLLA